MYFKFTDSSQMFWLRTALTQGTQAGELSPRALYKTQELYYLNNGLYDIVTQAAYENAIWTEGMKPLRNPANRAVEFYTDHLWPGDLPDALPILADNKRIIDPIYQIWKWSNWPQRKQLAARWFAMFGDLFIKISTRTNPAGQAERVYLQLIKPELVTDLDHDERDYLTYIRLDIPRTRRVNGKRESYTHTEVWDKASQLYRAWEHTKGLDVDLDKLGTTTQQLPLSTWGIDFIPFAHSKFKDLGESRGLGAITHTLDKIDEANRQATRLAQMLFRYNRPIMGVTAGGNDPSGRPLPPPRLGSSTGTDAADTVSLNDDTLLRLPGNASAFALVPNINYQAALAVLQDHMRELEQDLPELAYYRLKDKTGDLSGRAIRLMLSDATGKAQEARGNAEAALSRAHAMALTIGQNVGLFANIGNYEAGDFDHKFTPRPILPPDPSEISELISAEKAAGIPLITSLRRHGWTEADIKQLEKDRAADDERRAETFGQALLNQGRSFDQGQGRQAGQGTQGAQAQP